MMMNMGNQRLKDFKVQIKQSSSICIKTMHRSNKIFWSEVYL